MPENQRYLCKISIFYEMAVTKKTMKMNVGYMWLMPWSRLNWRGRVAKACGAVRAASGLFRLYTRRF